MFCQTDELSYCVMPTYSAVTSVLLQGCRSIDSRQAMTMIWHLWVLNKSVPEHVASRLCVTCIIVNNARREDLYTAKPITPIWVISKQNQIGRRGVDWCISRQINQFIMWFSLISEMQYAQSYMFCRLNCCHICTFAMHVQVHCSVTLAQCELRMMTTWPRLCDMSVSNLSKRPTNIPQASNMQTCHASFSISKNSVNNSGTLVVDNKRSFLPKWNFLHW